MLVNAKEIERRESTAAASTAAAPQRVAVFDLGSNSFHMIVAEVADDGRIRILDRARQMVRLGMQTLEQGIISPDAFQRGLGALRVLHERAAMQRPHVTLAVGTSALREASNGGEFVEAVRAALGLDVRVIDGIEEAELVYRGARQALALEGRRVALFDVGGGSTEVILGQEEGYLFTTSLRLGVLRLRDRWAYSDPPTPRECAVMADWAWTVLKPAIDCVREKGFDFVALTSGTALALGRIVGDELPPVQRVGAGELCSPQPFAGGYGNPVRVPIITAPRFRLRLSALIKWEARLARATARERSERWGIETGRAESIVPGIIIVRTIFELMGVDEAQVCGAALREGLIADWAALPRLA